MPNTLGVLAFPSALDDTISLLDYANSQSTGTQNAPLLTDSGATITVDVSGGNSTKGGYVAANGAISIADEIIYYATYSVSAGTGTFSGCVRGQDGTATVTHSASTVVNGYWVRAHLKLLRDASIAVETKLGSGSSTPASGQLLQSTGAGASGWSSSINLTGTLHTLNDSVSIIDNSTFSIAHLAIGKNMNAVGTATLGSANETGVNLQFNVTGATNSLVSYEKTAAIFYAKTADPSQYSPSLITRDVSGIDTRGYIAAGNTLGRAWGIDAQLQVLATADGYGCAGELEVYNKATVDQPNVNTSTSKYALHLVAGDVQHVTAGIFANTNGVGKFHHMLWMDGNDMAGSAGDTFLNLNNRFTVDYLGNVSSQAAGGHFFRPAGVALVDVDAYLKTFFHLAFNPSASGTGATDSANQFGLMMECNIITPSNSLVPYERSAIVGEMQTLDSAYDSMYAINLLTAGANYQSVPNISIGAPTGTTPVQATATAVMQLGSLSLTAGGSGYTNGTNYALGIAAPPAGGTQATGLFDVVGGAVSNLRISINGSGYTSQPAITFPGAGAGSGAAATAFLNVVGTTITQQGSGYTSAPTVTFSGGGASPTPTQATATSSVSVNVTRDCAGVDGRGYILGTTQGRAWGMYAVASVVNAQSDGYIVGLESETRNNGSDQASVGTRTTKLGFHTVAYGPNNGTCAIMIDGTNGAKWHKGIFCDPANLTATSTDMFIELLNTFVVTPAGHLGIGVSPPATTLDVRAGTSTDTTFQLVSAGGKSTYSYLNSSLQNWLGIIFQGAGTNQWMIGNRGGTIGDLSLYRTNNWIQSASFTGATGLFALGPQTPTYGLHLQGAAARVQTIANPAIPTITQTGAAGTTVYTYYIVPIDRNGLKGLPSPTARTTLGNATLNGTNFNVITWVLPVGAVSVDVIRASSGGTPATTGSIALANTGTSLNDTGLVASAYTTPTRNATADLYIDGLHGIGTVAPAYGLHVFGSSARVQALATPSAPTVTPTGGTATSFTYYVVANDWLGNHTLISANGTTAAGAATLDATHFNTISWSAVPNAVSYDLVRSVGGPSQGSIALGLTATSFVDTGYAAIAYTNPTRNATADLTVDGNALITPMANVAQSVAFTATVSKASTTTAQTISMVGTGVGTMTLPANFLVAGRQIRLKACGYLSTGGTAGTLNWLFQIGGSTIVSTGTVAPTISLTSLYWEIEVIATCRTVGANGTVMAEGRVLMPTSATAIAVWGLVETTASTVDTTASKLVDLQLTTSNTQHAITCTNCSLEVLN